MEVILRHELVESIRAGDKTVFVGSLIPVPDVGAISTPGEKIEASLSKGSLLLWLLLHMKEEVRFGQVVLDSLQ